MFKKTKKLKIQDILRNKIHKSTQLNNNIKLI